jgi:hypothetical protein
VLTILLFDNSRVLLFFPFARVAESVAVGVFVVTDDESIWRVFGGEYAGPGPCKTS